MDFAGNTKKKKKCVNLSSYQTLNIYSLVPELLMSVRMTESRPVERDYRMLLLQAI